MKYLISIQLLFFFIGAYGQNKLFTTSKIIGDSISLDEKKKYLLFKNVTDSLFLNARIYKVNDSLFISHIDLIDSLKSIDTLNRSDINEITIKVKKIEEYYDYINSKDSLKVKNFSLHRNLRTNNYESLEKLDKQLNSKEIREQLIPLYSTSPEAMKWKTESMRIQYQQQQIMQK